MRVVGAGVGRTGTFSLKLAFERLGVGRCYHGTDAFERGDDWSGGPVDLDGYAAAVDWPAAFYWDELADDDTLVVLSTRPVDDWWESCKATLFALWRTRDDHYARMMRRLLAERFIPAWSETAAKRAYVEHNDRVRAEARRLVEWEMGDGWAPLCAALECDEPALPFPHENTRTAFRIATGMLP